MVVVTLDVKGTHSKNPECPSRIVQKPDGNWLCVDCGLTILQRRIVAASMLERVMDDYEDTEDVPGGLGGGIFRVFPDVYRRQVKCQEGNEE